MNPKIEKCCGNCGWHRGFSEIHFDGSPVAEPYLSHIRKRCVCGFLQTEPEKWKTDGAKCRHFKPEHHMNGEK